MKIFGLEIRKQSLGMNDEFWKSTSITSESITGASVNTNTVLGIPAVLSCVNVLSKSIASLPLFLYERNGESRAKAINEPLYRVLHDNPNPEMTSFAFRQAMMTCKLLWGNSYSEIVKDAYGRVIALYPINPQYVTMYRDEKTLDIFYEVNIPGFSKTVLRKDQVLHDVGLSLDGLMGKSPITLCRETFGLAIASEKYGNAFFSNGGKPSGVLKHPGKLTKDGHDRLRKSWEDNYTGLSNAQRTAILEEGMSYESIGMPPGDAQFIETRKFTIEECARIFNVPLFLIQSVEKSTAWGSGIEQLNIAYITHSLRPLLVAFEQAVNWKCVNPKDYGKLFAEFSVEGLMRGDAQSRSAFYASARQNGWLSVNEIRNYENLAEIEGGDIYLEPMNMQPAGSNPPDTKRSAIPIVEKRDSEDVFAAARPFMIDAISRITRRAKADLSRQLSKSDSGASSILENYFNAEFSSFAISAILPVYSGIAAGLKTGDTNIWAANMITRFSSDCLAVCNKAIEQTSNASASVDGALSAVLSNSAIIADAEIEIIKTELENSEEQTDE